MQKCYVRWKEGGGNGDRNDARRFSAANRRQALEEMKI
jgi:hypothetical protein